MTERSCHPAFSLPFHSLIAIGQIDFPGEVPNQLDLLGLVRRVDDNLLYKLN